MNITDTTILERRLADALLLLLASAPGFGAWKISHNPASFDRAFDFLATGKSKEGTKLELWVDCHADPRPVMFPYVGIEKEFEGAKTKVARVRVFGAPRIGPRMAETCWDHGWGWFDLAGNCRIGVPGVFYLERTGKPPVGSTVRPRANLSSREAARVLRALLIEPRDRWTHESLRSHCFPSVSIGLVNKLAQHLRDERYVEYFESPGEGFQVKDRVGLLTAWREAYRFDRHERQSYFTLLTGKKLRDALVDLDAEIGDTGVVYASFSAAEFQAPHVRQPKTWLFLDPQHLPALKRRLEVKEGGLGENLIVLLPDDPGVFYLADGGTLGDRRIACTNAVQTYVDLWHSSGRGREAAEALLEHKLKPEWKVAGLTA